MSITLPDSNLPENPVAKEINISEGLCEVVVTHSGGISANTVITVQGVDVSQFVRVASLVIDASTRVLVLTLELFPSRIRVEGVPDVTVKE